MKLSKWQASRIAGLSSLSAEAKLCFAAAGGCGIIGAIGYAVNTLTTTETTLSAFLVVSAFYLVLGGISVFNASPEYPKRQPARTGQSVDRHTDDDDFIESAA